MELRLVGLYGNLGDDRYGNLDSGVLYSKDITSKLKAKTAETVAEEDFGRASVTHGTAYTDSQLVTIPASVFRYCGYDAIQVVVTDKNGSVIEKSSQRLVRLAEPMNLELNSGNVINLSADATGQAVLDYNANVFIDNSTVTFDAAALASIAEQTTGNTWCFFLSTAFVPENDRALNWSMAGNTGNYTGSDPDVLTGAYEYSRCGYSHRVPDGWRCEIVGTGW